MRIILSLILAIILPNSLFAMNDTDGVVARGLFPLGQGSKQLKLLSETIDINANLDNINVRRSYIVKNIGKKDQYVLGTIYCYNCISNTDGEVIAKISNSQIRLKDSNDFLMDRGDHIKLHKMAKQDCAKALEDLDGNIACHSWGSATVSFEAAEIKEITLQYSFSRPLGYLQSQLYLYTEKFWQNVTIPKIVININTGTFPVDFFAPDSRNPNKKKLNYSIQNNVLQIIIENYSPVKRSYTYSDHLFSSFMYQREDASSYIPKEKQDILYSYLKDASTSPSIFELSKTILGYMHDERVIPYLIKDLEDEKEAPETTQKFLIAMGKESVAPLIKLLNSRSQKVRYNALSALYRIKDERVIEPVISLLRDDNLSIVYGAIVAVKHLKDSRATPPLLELLTRNDFDDKIGVIYALGEIKDRKAVGPVRDGLKNDVFDDQTAIAAITVLAYNLRGYDRATIESILNILKSNRGQKVKEEAARALGEMTYPDSVYNNFGTDYISWRSWLDRNLSMILEKKSSAETLK